MKCKKDSPGHSGNDQSRSEDISICSIQQSKGSMSGQLCF